MDLFKKAKQVCDFEKDQMVWVGTNEQIVRVVDSTLAFMVRFNYIKRNSADYRRVKSYLLWNC